MCWFNGKRKIDITKSSHLQGLLTQRQANTFMPAYLLKLDENSVHNIFYFYLSLNYTKEESFLLTQPVTWSAWGHSGNCETYNTFHCRRLACVLTNLLDKTKTIILKTWGQHSIIKTSRMKFSPCLDFSYFFPAVTLKHLLLTLSTQEANVMKAWLQPNQHKQRLTQFEYMYVYLDSLN